MSGKNRVCALAVATAALVGLSAPVASAASFSGPSGFNNDSILNVSGNQLPVQACNDYLPVNAGGNQTVLPSITTALGLGTLGSQPSMSATNTSCTQNPAEANTATVATSSTSSVETPGDTTSGFNNDSIVNLSGNQLPVQACNDSLPTNGSGNQLLASSLVGAFGVLSPGVVLAAPASSSPGAISAAQDSSCTQNPSEASASSVTSSN